MTEEDKAGSAFDRARLADQAEITALVTEFAHLIDRGQSERVADLFTADGWYGREDGSRSIGHDAIRAAYARRGADSPERVCRHLFTNLRISFDGDALASGLSTLILVAGDGAPPLPVTITLVQDYVDTYALAGGRWLFRSRETRRLFVGDGFRDVLRLGNPA